MTTILEFVKSLWWLWMLVQLVGWILMVGVLYERNKKAKAPSEWPDSRLQKIEKLFCLAKWVGGMLLVSLILLSASGAIYLIDYVKSLLH